MASLPRSHRIVGRWVPSAGATGFRLVDRVRSNHGTLTNMDPASDWVASGGKLALDFDGSNDEIVVGDHPSLSFTSANSITMMAWVKPSTSANYRTIFTKRIANSSNYELSFNNSDNKILFYAGGGFAVSTVAAAQDVWSHVCCTSGPSGGAYFINGVAAGTHANPIGTPNSEPLRIGSANNQQRFPGQIDDAIIFNAALTANEVREIYRLGRGYGVFPEPDFDEGFAAAGFKAYWARRQSQLIGGGV